MSSTRVFTIAPNPHWVIIDNFSKLPNGAAIYTYRSLDPSEFKPAFQDAAGQVPYGQPIVGFGNGTMPPIYWEFDSNFPEDTYYIRVYDSDDPQTQQFLWDFNGISGNSGGGGGTIITAYDIENLIVNNIFYRNVGDQAGTPSLPTSITLAPGAHEGFVNDPANLNVINNGPVSPDIIFAKNNTTASDSISFQTFSPLGIHALPGMDITPTQFLRYVCSGAGAGETYKYIQFPISQGVQNLSAQPVTLKIYARCNSGDPTLNVSWRQFFGSGAGASADVVIPAGSSMTLSSSWQVFTINTTVPDVTTKTLGATPTGNDGLFLQLNFPLSPSTTSIDIIKPEMYLGTVAPGVQYDTNDQIDSLINTPRTGDVRTTLNTFVPGWVQMNDGTIGNASSNATARANVDTFALFCLIWNTFQSNQALAPMYTSAGASTAYGVSASSDYNLNRQISLTRNLGRVMAGALPVQISQAFTNTGNTLTVASTASFFTGVPVVVTGGALPTPLALDTSYYVIQQTSTTMQLALTAEDAIAGTPITLTTNASGNVLVASEPVGAFVGRTREFLAISQMPTHNHPGSTVSYVNSGPTFDPPNALLSRDVITGTTSNPLHIANQGDGAAHNNMQPTVFMNVLIKL